MTARLWLAYNEFTGTIPSSLGGLSQLQILHLFENRLTGEIPSSLGDLSQLRSLWLDNNPFTEGELPSFISGLTNLTDVFLGNRNPSLPWKYDKTGYSISQQQCNHQSWKASSSAYIYPPFSQCIYVVNYLS